MMKNNHIVQRCTHCLGALFFLIGLSCAGLWSTPLVPPVSFEMNRLQLDPHEIQVVDKLIEATQRQLRKQQEIKGLMMRFEELKEEFIQGNQTTSHTTRLVKLARQIYTLLCSEHCEHLFAKDYLDELQFFSSIAGKTSLGRP